MWILLLFLAAALTTSGHAQTVESAEDSAQHLHHMHHMDHDMRMDMEGMVMYENTERLPRDCAQVSVEQEITVRAGKKYAHRFSGLMFAYDQQEWQVEPCAKVTVTVINEDNVRHQWMVHGLPRYLYPQGMFHIEVNGGQKKTGTFIVSSAPMTYLVHCDIAHHTEKGMKAQLKVGGGNGDLPSIPGLTGPRQPDQYPVQWTVWTQGLMLAVSLVGAVLVVKGLGRWL